MEVVMKPEDYMGTTISTISIDTDSTWHSTDDLTVTISDYVDTTLDTLDLSSITSTMSGITLTTSKKRTDVRDNGNIPIDIWAKLYNNGVIEDDDEELPF
jgi:hypothetical protein